MSTKKRVNKEVFTENDAYITNMFKQMTDKEKKNIMELDFDTLWMNLWQNTLSSTSLYKSE
jgi:hypothetical protein